MGEVGLGTAEDLGHCSIFGGLLEELEYVLLLFSEEVLAHEGNRLEGTPDCIGSGSSGIQCMSGSRLLSFLGLPYWDPHLEMAYIMLKVGVGKEEITTAYDIFSSSVHYDCSNVSSARD